jgi:hypothetical protein
MSSFPSDPRPQSKLWNIFTSPYAEFKYIYFFTETNFSSISRWLSLEPLLSPAWLDNLHWASSSPPGTEEPPLLASVHSWPTRPSLFPVMGSLSRLGSFCFSSVSEVLHMHVSPLPSPSFTWYPGNVGMQCEGSSGKLGRSALNLSGSGSACVLLLPYPVFRELMVGASPPALSSE